VLAVGCQQTLERNQLRYLLISWHLTVSMADLPTKHQRSLKLRLLGRSCLSGQINLMTDFPAIDDVCKQVPCCTRLASPRPSSLNPDTNGALYASRIRHGLGCRNQESSVRRKRDDMDWQLCRTTEKGMLRSFGSFRSRRRMHSEGRTVHGRCCDDAGPEERFSGYV
jgi:hypothetical protein